MGAKIIAGYVYSLILLMVFCGSNYLFAQRASAYTKNIKPLKNNFSNMPGFFDTYLVSKNNFYLELPSLLMNMIIPTSAFDFGLNDNFNIGFNPTATLLAMLVSKNLGGVVKARTRLYGSSYLQEVMTLYFGYFPSFELNNTFNLYDQDDVEEDENNTDKVKYKTSFRYIFFTNNFAILFSQDSILTLNLMGGKWVIVNKDISHQGIYDSTITMGNFLGGLTYQYILSDNLAFSTTLLFSLYAKLNSQTNVSDLSWLNTTNFSIKRVCLDYVYNKNYLISGGTIDMGFNVWLLWITGGITF